MLIARWLGGRAPALAEGVGMRVIRLMTVAGVIAAPAAFLVAGASTASAAEAPAASGSSGVISLLPTAASAPQADAATVPVGPSGPRARWCGKRTFA